MSKDMVKYHYDMACKIADKKIIKMARKILKEHSKLNEFIMGMGIWSFTDKKDNDLTREFKYTKQLEDFIDEWDECLKLTGEGMRFTARGKIIRKW